MRHPRRIRPQAGEQGFVMIVAVVLLSVVASLGAIVMMSGNHSSQSTGRGRSWIQSLHVAEAGIQDSLVRMQSTGGAPAPFTGQTDEGTYSVTVTPLGRARFRVEATGLVADGSTMRATRKVQVTLMPPESFRAALFSYTSIDTKNNDVVTGDVWANQNVIVDIGDRVEGNVTAATGYVHMRNDSRVTKSITTGGYNPANTAAVYVDTNGIVQGSVTASVTAPTDPVTCGGESHNNFTIRLNGGSTVAGNTTTWGSKQGPGNVYGTVTDQKCTAAPAAQPLPSFSYNAANYDPATLHEFGTPAAPSANALADFNTYLSANLTSMSGTFAVFSSAPGSQSNRIDLTGVVITGDLTIVTNLPIFSNGITDSTSVTDAIAVFASFYQPPTGTVCDVNHDASECAVHIKNNFRASGETACLVFAPYGPVAVKNNQQMFGAIYADNIQIKNNQKITYDSRVDRIVGYGEITLVPVDWMELQA